MVTIDAVTGQVDALATAAAKPAVTSSAGRLTYRGKFRAIYNVKGINVAPSGASKLGVDRATGRLLSFKLLVG